MQRAYLFSRYHSDGWGQTTPAWATQVWKYDNDFLNANLELSVKRCCLSCSTAAPSLIGQSDSQSEPAVLYKGHHNSLSPLTLSQGHTHCLDNSPCDYHKFQNGSSFLGFFQRWVELILTFWVFGVELQLTALFLLQSAMRDLVDIFDPSDTTPQPEDLWNAVRSSKDVASDPWDSVGVCVGSRHSACSASSSFLFVFIICVSSHRSALQHSCQALLDATSYLLRYAPSLAATPGLLQRPPGCSSCLLHTPICVLSSGC